MPPEDPKQSPDRKGEVAIKERPKLEKARRYMVIFHNDDYTTREFVVLVLMKFFNKTETEATHVMLTVHKMGAATAGVYTREVAETKVQQVIDHARKHGMPLLLTAEPE